ncbi:hypothetical protein N7478_013372 [Penicillium angulare]|uniref:uncharacterized protein n=1 Tax=Penicillium angulare TaxID=116970 RepID=UPI0025407D30|nr:uncharacterized protein N7478_013372 [Penicillium angulare]KAJ5257268.1 hypothetical protein N7478_013372 [Penicillium angulare]
MKVSPVVLALANLISAATAQLSDLPTCAQSCATNAIPSNCGIDVACICNSSSFLASIACCIAGKCDEADQEKTLKAAKGICAAGGVTDIPTTVACTTGSAASAASTASTTSTDNSNSTITSSSASKTTGSSSATSASASTSTAGAILGQATDVSLMAAAGVAAAFAIFV